MKLDDTEVMSDVSVPTPAPSEEEKPKTKRAANKKTPAAKPSFEATESTETVEDLTASPELSTPSDSVKAEQKVSERLPKQTKARLGGGKKKVAKFSGKKKKTAAVKRASPRKNGGGNGDKSTGPAESTEVPATTTQKKE